jgi:soluble lytic murein transglycosylase-like protein
MTQRRGCFFGMKRSWKDLACIAVVLGAAWAFAANAPVAAAPGMIVVYEATLSNGFSLRYDHGEVLQNVTRLYLSSDPARGYVDVPSTDILNITREEVPASAPAKAADMGQIVSTAGARHQVDPDLINSVIRAESGFNPKAISPKGAQGLMQLMPQTAFQLGVSNPFEPMSNVDGGTRYLSELLQQYQGDMVKALAAYNAGPQRVAQYGGVPPYRETHAYVARVIRDYNRTKLAQHPELRKSAARTHRNRSQSTPKPAAPRGVAAKAQASSAP